MLLFAFFVVVAMMQNDKTTGLPRPVCAIHCCVNSLEMRRPFREQARSHKEMHSNCGSEPAREEASQSTQGQQPLHQRLKLQLINSFHRLDHRLRPALKAQASPEHGAENRRDGIRVAAQAGSHA